MAWNGHNSLSALYNCVGHAALCEWTRINAHVTFVPFHISPCCVHVTLWKINRLNFHVLSSTHCCSTALSHPYQSWYLYLLKYHIRLMPKCERELLSISFLSLSSYLAYTLRSFPVQVLFPPPPPHTHIFSLLLSNCVCLSLCVNVHVCMGVYTDLQVAWQSMDIWNFSLTNDKWERLHHYFNDVMVLFSHWSIQNSNAPRTVERLAKRSMYFVCLQIICQTLLHDHCKVVIDTRLQLYVCVCVCVLPIVLI